MSVIKSPESMTKEELYAELDALRIGLAEHERALTTARAERDEANEARDESKRHAEAFGQLLETRNAECDALRRELEEARGEAQKWEDAYSVAADRSVKQGAENERLREAIEEHKAWMDERFKDGEFMPNEVDRKLYAALSTPPEGEK